MNADNQKLCDELSGCHERALRYLDYHVALDFTLEPHRHRKDTVPYDPTGLIESAARSCAGKHKELFLMLHDDRYRHGVFPSQECERAYMCAAAGLGGPIEIAGETRQTAHELAALFCARALDVAGIIHHAMKDPNLIDWDRVLSRIHESADLGFNIQADDFIQMPVELLADIGRRGMWPRVDQGWLSSRLKAEYAGAMRLLGEQEVKTAQQNAVTAKPVELDATGVDPTAHDDDAFLGAAQLAKQFGVSQAALESLLRRWREDRTNAGSWVENSDRSPREMKYLHQVKSVRKTIEGLKNRQTKRQAKII